MDEATKLLREAKQFLDYIPGPVARALCLQIGMFLSRAPAEAPPREPQLYPVRHCTTCGWPVYRQMCGCDAAIAEGKPSE